MKPEPKTKDPVALLLDERKLAYRLRMALLRKLREATRDATNTLQLKTIAEALDHLGHGRRD